MTALAHAPRAGDAARAEPSPRTALPDERRWRLVPILVVAIAFAVAVWAIGPWAVGAFVDDGIYVVLAKALATGHGFHYLNLPGEPAATHFPPGYPLFLSLLWRISPDFPRNLALFKFANALLLSLGALGTYQFARRRFALHPLVAGAVALLGVLSTPFLLLASMLLSEPLFFALLVPTLLAAERLVDRAPEVRLVDERRSTFEASPDRMALAVGVLCGLLALVRTLGVVVAPAAALLLLHRRRPRAALVVLATAGVVLLPWQLWTAMHGADLPAVLRGEYGSYSGWLVRGVRERGLLWVPSVIASNLGEIFRQTLAPAFTPASLPWLVLPALLAVTSLGATGARRLTRQAPVTAIALALYAAIVLVWPFGPNRFVWGIWPMVTLLLALGVADVVTARPARTSMRLGRGFLITGALIAVAGLAGHLSMTYRARWWDTLQRSHQATLEPVLAWATARTAPTDVIATEGENTVYLYTGRRAVPNYTFTAEEYLHPVSAERSADAVQQIIDAARPTYVLTGQGPAGRAAALLARSVPPRIQLIDTLANGVAVFVPTGYASHR